MTLNGRCVVTEGAEYQLITWSKDRTLRFWPVDSETMEAGASSESATQVLTMLP